MSNGLTEQPLTEQATWIRVTLYDKMTGQPIFSSLTDLQPVLAAMGITPGYPLDLQVDLLPPSQVRA